MSQVRIEVQDQFVQWHEYQTASGSPPSIKLALQSALRTQLAAKSGTARAVDVSTGVFVDIAFSQRRSRRGTAASSPGIPLMKLK